MEPSSETDIHTAAREGKTTVIESFLASDPKLVHKQDVDGRLPIHWAISSGHRDAVILLSGVEDFDPDVQDGSGWTPLMIAVSLKDGEGLVDLLLQKGADVNARNFNDQTALHFTASKNNLEIARRLLNNKPPASTRLKDKRGQYPIHRAAAVGSSPMVNLLLKHKSPINAPDIAGQTPLHHAIAEAQGDTALTLLKGGAETDKKDADGLLALELSPDAQVRKFILQGAEREGIEL